MDYYGPMVLFHSFRIAALTTMVALTVHSAWAQTAGSEADNAASEPQVTSSPALDAELFYEIFLGELSARTGDPGAGYAFMLRPHAAVPTVSSTSALQTLRCSHDQANTPLRPPRPGKKPCRSRARPTATYCRFSLH